jgi:hypothetical protein
VDWFKDFGKIVDRIVFGSLGKSGVQKRTNLFVFEQGIVQFRAFEMMDMDLCLY